MFKFLSKYGFYLMIIVILSELLIPFLFAAHYPHYNQLTMLISDFGENSSPVQPYFKAWQFLDGLLIWLTIPSFYVRFKETSALLAKLLSLSLALYALGDCIFSAFFDRTLASGFSLEEEIHDYGSGIAFVALLVGVFLLIKLYSLESNTRLVKLFLILFIFSTFFMILYAAPRIPIIKTFKIPDRGLWQRLNLLFLYLPFLIVSFINLPPFIKPTRQCS